MSLKLSKIEQLCKEPEGWEKYIEYSKRYSMGIRTEVNPLSHDEVAEYTFRINSAIKSLKEICLNTNLSVDDRYKALVIFNKLIPDEGLDMLIRFRDLLNHLQNQQYTDIVKILVRITRCPDMSSHERLITAVSLYNCFALDVCYGCFADLACDKSLIIKYRVEAIRYLFATEDDEYLELAQEMLTEIINNKAYPDKFRYEVIAGFIHKTGINTMLNTDKIRVPYDEEFVYCLQNAFFMNVGNEVRYRILSGQHMLQMKCITIDEKNVIAEVLLDIARNADYEENVKADAADVVLRLGSSEFIAKARQIITDMGYAPVDSRASFLDKARTIYSNRQNVHDVNINESVVKFIDRIVTQNAVSFADVHRDVTAVIREHELSHKQRVSAYQALDRISIDTSTFTDKNVTIAEVFIHVWLTIQKYDDTIRTELEKRMVEELVDMSATCSSGHTYRFVNVLSTYDTSLTISWKAQIEANIAARVNARIRDISDEDLRVSVAMGSMEKAEPEDRKVYVEFIRKALSSVREEMYKEFVGDKYISEAEFEQHFASGKEKVLLITS